MSEWGKQSIRELLDGQWPGEWGSEPNTISSPVIVYRSTEIDDDGHLQEDGGVYRTIQSTKLNNKKLVFGDILLEASGGTPDRPVGRVALFSGLQTELAVCSNFLRTLRPKKNVCCSFLRWALVFLHQQSVIWKFQQQTTGMINLKVNDYLKHQIETPPIAEQRRIAEILSTVDEAIEQTEALIEKYQQIKAGLMHDLFTRGILPNGKLRPTRDQAPDLYKESPLGWIPKEWVVVCIAEVFEIQLGKMLNKLAKTGKWSALYLGNRAVQWDFVDCLSIEEMDFTPFERQKFQLLPGDLLVCEGGEVGRTAIWRGEIEDCYYQKAIQRLRPKANNALPMFMLRFMRFAREHGYFREFTSQSSIAHLTQEKLGRIPMLFPPIEEQERIAGRFDSIDVIIQSERSKSSKLRQQKQGLMHDLLTGRVRVKEAAMH